MSNITIDMDRPCSRCGKNGAANGGLCLSCVLDLMDKKIRLPKTKHKRAPGKAKR